jgi:DNA-binding NtrC family response regulator
VDARIVAATNRDLPSMVESGRFRADLFYRLSGVELVVPPLRVRSDDIPLLADHFVAHHRSLRVVSLSPPAMEALGLYDWPGNVRQLMRVLERAVALAPSPVIAVSDLPADVSRDHRVLMRPVTPRDDTLRAWSSRYVRMTLDRCDGNKRRACEMLDISYHTLQSHIDYDPAARVRRTRKHRKPEPAVRAWLDATG